MGSYTPEQVSALRKKINKLRTQGKPEKALDLLRRLREDQPIHPHEYADSGVIPEKKVTDFRDLEPPPYTGPGSSGEAWRAWAIKVADIEPEVLVNLGRNQIVDLLRDRKILPPE